MRIARALGCIRRQSFAIAYLAYAEAMQLRLWYFDAATLRERMNERFPRAHVAVVVSRRKLRNP